MQATKQDYSGMDEMKRLGAALADRREHLGFNQADMARYTGSSPKTITKLEQGLTANPDLDTWRKICTGYRVDVEWIRNYLDEVPANLRRLERTEIYAVSPLRNDAHLRKSQGGLTMDERQALLQVMESMAEGIAQAVAILKGDDDKP